MYKTSLIFTFLLGIYSTANAQQTIAVGGSNATGTGGSASYTIGQVVYTVNTSSIGSLVQGVQQPFEIQTVLGFDNKQINLSFLAYPNPTVGMLTLDIGDFDYSKTTFQLFNLNGKLLIEKKINESKSTISMEKYPQATYILNVLDNNKTLKTFKIIKNQ